jgi:RNA polymerase sigma-70 factor (ECF subfamily)
LRFELLYAKYAPAVKAYALRRAEVAAADDVVAEVFVVCWRRFDEVPADPLP